MCNSTRFRSFLSLILVFGVVLATGCGTQIPHPNQFSTFDGASYDTLTLAHGALTSLRSEVSVSYPKYTALFNQVAVSYAASYDAYAVYRANPKDQAALTIAIANLTVSIVALENSFESDLEASPALVRTIRSRARTLRSRAAGQQVTVSDILTELEIAAAIARAIPAMHSFAGIASMVIAATNEALAAESANSGQPIDLSTIQPIPSV